LLIATHKKHIFFSDFSRERERERERERVKLIILVENPTYYEGATKMWGIALNEPELEVALFEQMA
jgi:hypothetical protein